MEENNERILERDTEWLPVPLTTEELAQRGIEIGRRTDDRIREEADFDAAKEDHKGRLKRIEGDISQLARTLSTGKESREVGTITAINWNAKVVETRRCDQGTVIRTRPLRPEEHQQEMFRRKEAGEEVVVDEETIRRARGAHGKE